MTIQVKNFTDTQIKQEAQKILDDGYTLHHEQDMDQFEVVDYCRRIGNTDDDKLGYMAFNPKENPDVTRVTPGPTGLFGHSDLHWHSNGTVFHIGEFKEILIALYCENECVDTVFSLLNCKQAYDDLDSREKDYWSTIDIQLNNLGTGIYGEAQPQAEGSLDEYVQMDRHEGDDRMPVVNSHPVDGKKFLYWQPPLIEKAWKDGEPTDVEEIKEKLKATLDRSIYQKHFVFKKGDILIMDQLSTLHRRSPVVNKARLLWRVAFDYTKVFDYS